MAAGSWSNRFFGGHFGPPDVTHSSNVTNLVYGGRGRLTYVRMSGGIWQATSLSGTGKDIRPQMRAGVVTFAHNGDAKGIYQTSR